MLRNIRIAIAAIFFAGISLLFIGIGQDWWGWMAKLQFGPVLRAGISAAGWSLAALAFIIVLTLLLGRVYCSTICPLGVFQDIVNNLSSRRKGKARRFHFRKESSAARFGVLLLFLASWIAGAQLVVAILEPYSAYGRIVKSIVSPVGLGWAVCAVAFATLLAVALLAWFYGRLYCNTVCPMGTLLGLFSGISLLRPRIDKDKCTGCHSCEKKCKASCIDSANMKIDASRCVACFDCIENCKAGAISFGRAPKAPKTEDAAGRRAFLSSAALLGGALTLEAQEKKVDGGLAVLEGKKIPQREGRLVPFGAGSEDSFYSKCTACQLCIAACPNNVLRPSKDLQHLMQPEASYEKGWCRPECTACSEVCPAGAIAKITPEEKTSISIGRATIDYDLCVAFTEKDECGNCARHCPSEAILMVKKEGSKIKIPSVCEEKCLGCGACEYLCPSRPYSAIHVNGLKKHIIHG